MAAARRARAMILAPRSCPARPGLATTTRILRAVAASMDGGSLEDGRLGIGAEDFLHRRDHLPLGGAGARRLENRRHQVGLAPRRLLQLCQRALDRGPVAASPRRPQAAGLLAFERRVDAEDRGRRLVLLGEVVDADDDAAALVDPPLGGEGGVGELALREGAAG